MSDIGKLSLSALEKKELADRIQKALQRSEFSAILVAGPSNFTYLTAGIVLPFADQNSTYGTAILITADGEKDAIICPPDLRQIVQDQGWKKKLLTYAPDDGPPIDGIASAAAGILKKLGSGALRIAVDYSHTSHALLEKLKKATPGIKWGDCDPLLRKLRMIKTPAEVRLLETAVRTADRAYVAALNHTESSVHDGLGYLLWEFSERVRVHVGEFGGSGIGNLMTVQDSGLFYGLPEKHERFRLGALSRCEWTSHHIGYWANSGRTLVVDEPDAAQKQSYADNMSLKETAVRAVRAGVESRSVFDAVGAAARQRGIRFWQKAGVGHGVGTSEREAPFLGADDDTVLDTGMVVVIAVYTLGPKDELICSKDTYEITEKGSRLLSWYKSYDDLYKLIGSTARHG